MRWLVGTGAGSLYAGSEYSSILECDGVENSALTCWLLEVRKREQKVHERTAEMLYMVIERYHNRDPRPVYQRFRERGRMLPDGLRYVSSWVEDTLDRCFQLMECDDPNLFAEWQSHWKDLCDFEVVRVLSSAEAATAALSGQELP